MNTAPLKNFATWARRELITQVSARLTAVLAPASPERVENQRAVSILERDIASAGGGARGKDAITDRVAYTWFNRIIALRFMDANGYTGIGVVSPAHGQQTGQPEILADAKRGSIDPAVVSNKRTLDTITGLLDGTRPSADAQGEAYTLLLAEYCRYWNRSMPFMFEREGDYTELLIPSNLLAADSILSKAAATLTEEVCHDGGDAAGGVEVIGWLYQFYISERKDEVFAGFKKGKKAGAAEIPAATQLFTPHWIVRYLVENSLGRLWMLNHPSSRLVEQMDYYIAPVDEETDFLRIDSAEELKIIDPACGSGHMLSYAFDLLHAIYEEEGYAPSEIPGLILTHNLYGTEIDPRAGALAAFALTMKARAKQRRFFSKRVAPNIRVLEPRRFTAHELHLLRPPTIGRADQHRIDAFWNQFQHADTFGSLIRTDADLIEPLRAHVETLEEDALDTTGLREAAEIVLDQAEYLSQRYHVAIANPPYMGGKQMNPLLSQFMKDEYPEAKSDLFAAFFSRTLHLVAGGGQLGFMSPFVWMFISSYQKLRERFTQGETMTSLIQLEYSGFDGATVPICTFTLQRGHKEFRAAYVRLSDFVGAFQQADRALEIIQAGVAKERGRWALLPDMAAHFYRATASDFKAIPGSPVVYWLSEKMRAAFSLGRSMSQIGSPKAGMHGGDVNRFARRWYEVSERRSCRDARSAAAVHATECRWVGLNKGGSFRKWYGNQEYVLAFDIESYEILKVSGNKLPSRDFYFLPSVSWSKVSSGSPAFRMYPHGFVFDVSGTPVFASENNLLDICAVANSEPARRLLEAMAPTLNFEIGQVAALPILSTAHLDPDRSRTKRLISESKADWDSVETSWSFERNPLVAIV